MSYLPDITRYQQIALGGETGKYDCTAWSAALYTDAHTSGAVKLTGRQIRLASDEKVPDPKSPGLNLDQVDAAVWKLTSAQVDPDTHRGITIAEAQSRIVAGEWAELQVWRGSLVNAGFGGGNSFIGGHAITVHVSAGAPVIGDPLVPYYIRATWSAIWRACGHLAVYSNGGELGYGRAYAAFLSGPVVPVATAPGGNNVAIRYATVQTAGARIQLAAGTGLYERPGGTRVTRMARSASPLELGLAGSVNGKAWRAVLVGTAWSYRDGNPHKTVLYVPASAGKVVPA